MKKFLLALTALFVCTYAPAAWTVTGGRTQTCRATQAVPERETEIMRLTGPVVSHKEHNKVILYGTYRDKSLYARKLRIEIRDTEQDRLLAEIRPEIDYGYAPKLLLLDFMGNGLEQIYLTSDSGGSGGFAFYEIFDAQDAAPNSIFSNRSFNERFRYTAEYADGYRIVLSRTGGDETYLIDISGRGKEYLDALYQPDGTLKRPQAADVSELNTAFPYFNASSNRWQMMAMQRVTGLFGADGFGYVLNLMTYRDGRFDSYFPMAGILPQRSQD